MIYPLARRRVSEPTDGERKRQREFLEALARKKGESCGRLGAVSRYMYAVLVVWRWGSFGEGACVRDRRVCEDR